MPWGFDERRDTAQVLDWIVSQRWSSGQVIAACPGIWCVHLEGQTVSGTVKLEMPTAPCQQAADDVIRTWHPGHCDVEQERDAP